MNEIKIIMMRPVSFWSRIIAGAATQTVALLEAFKDKPLGDISAVTWIIIVASLAGGMAITASAWISTSSSDARQETNGKTQPQT